VKAILAFDLNDEGITPACIATRCAATAQPCPHDYTWQCPHARERYVFVTTSPAAAEAMGAAVLTS
jgi:hypothetical protein